MANMNVPAVWHDEHELTNHLGSELNRGRLALFLGAGISTQFGLPDWRTLVDRLCAACSEATLSPGDDPINKAEALRLRHYKDHPDQFLDAVGTALYQSVRVDFDTLQANRTLSAIGSLVMASKRGSASTVVSLNYDDLLETFLEYHGFVTKSVFHDQFWAGNQDVTIYHPHGFLPLQSRERSKEIVLGINDYVKFTDPQKPWHSLLDTLMRTHTFLYVGLSGDDRNLQNLLAPLKPRHAIARERYAYHGVRFAVDASTQAKDTETVMDAWGVVTHWLPDWKDLPQFLFRVCQAARESRVLREE